MGKRTMTAAEIDQRRQASRQGGAVHADQIRQAKEVLQAHHANRTPPAYTRSDIIAARLAAYIVNARREDRPLTETGLIVALRIAPTMFEQYKAGKRDHLQEVDIDARESNHDIDIEIIQTISDGDTAAIYYYLMDTGHGSTDNNDIVNNDIVAPAMSDVIQKARLLVTLEREERLAKSGKVGDIFTMKAREGWQDTTAHTTNVLQITTRNATEALQLLGYQRTNDNEV